MSPEYKAIFVQHKPYYYEITYRDGSYCLLFQTGDRFGHFGAMTRYPTEEQCFEFMRRVLVRYDEEPHKSLQLPYKDLQLSFLDALF